MKDSVTIRKGTRDDVSALLSLIKDLAVYEKEPEAVIITEQTLLEDGFGKKSLFEFLVAEHNDEVVGIALYYTKYSTWKGRCIYLEDIVIKASERQKGIGSLLLLKLKEIAEKEGVKRLEWQVLEWNESAISFYKKYGAVIDTEWFNCKFEF